MPEFQCRIMTNEGTVEEKLVVAETKMDVYTQADERGEMLLSVKEKKAGLGGVSVFNRRKR